MKIEDYDGLTRDVLVERLMAAERACVLFGWTAASSTERGKAAHQLWRAWLSIAGEHMASPETHPEMTDAYIANLAAERDAIRSRTLARIFGS